MHRSRLPKLSQIFAGLLSALLLATLAVPLFAQPARESHPFYDVTKEVTLRGTVSSVLTRPSTGMIIGSHLLLTTTSGEVDASLGRWGMQGKGALSVSAGEEVEVTGVMKMLRDKPVFVVRSVKVGSQVYEMRNEYGIPVSPQSRERSNLKATLHGGSL